ncbi:sulfatase [Verrucomicrobiaceae bacterium 5K15]|uniref:Sulfatase n=1 Tax=Oceaniferula flava TaxID=2800421 RepID=A0AAE2SCN7_9BACT|nr:sulfatase [Oceaniferula flavus]MBK1855409.1 sulfatase [Oceaniferula flavus]MBM1136715.1 sulfatase [Oceaniferula flavus]
MKLLVAALSLVLLPATLFAKQPNILLIYADDFGYTDIAAQGSDFYETPNLDQLQASAMRFTQGYSACANCAPSRASLMSGLYTSRHKVYTVGNSDRGKSHQRKLIPVKNTESLADKFTTLPQILKAAGYATCHAGKWHVSSDPTQKGFDHNIGGNHTGGPRGGYFSPYNNPQLPDGPEGEHLPDRLATDLNRWINRQHEEKRPFFAYMSFYSVHTPIQARDDLAAKYAKKTPGKNHQHVKYAAMVEAMDLAIGKILKNLEQQGLADDTIVIFSSDNGPYGPASNARPLRGVKGMFYEGGIRVPFFVRWPGKTTAGSQSDVPVHQLDLFPTLAKAAGAELPETYDGVDLRGVLGGEDLASRSLYWHFPCYLQSYGKKGMEDARLPKWRATPCSVIRHGDWKLIQYFEDNSVELFNLKADPSERNNLAKSQPEKAAALLKKLSSWQTETDADIPTEPNPDFGKPGKKKANKPKG